MRSGRCVFLGVLLAAGLAAGVPAGAVTITEPRRTPEPGPLPVGDPKYFLGVEVKGAELRSTTAHLTEPLGVVRMGIHAHPRLDLGVEAWYLRRHRAWATIFPYESHSGRTRLDLECVSLAVHPVKDGWFVRAGVGSGGTEFGEPDFPASLNPNQRGLAMVASGGAFVHPRRGLSATLSLDYAHVWVAGGQLRLVAGGLGLNTHF